MNQPEDNFIGRWSRRKKEARQVGSDVQPTVADRESQPHVHDRLHGQQEDTDRETPAAEADQPVTTVAEAGVSPDEAVLTDDDMVDLDTLDANSDYTPFMSEGVSSELRKAALKKLFFSGKFAARDGLDDYDDDFTYFEPLGDTVTSDMKFHARRKEKERLAKLEEERLALEAQAGESAPDAEETDAHEQPGDAAEAGTTSDKSSESDSAKKPESGIELNTNPAAADQLQPQHASTSAPSTRLPENTDDQQLKPDSDSGASA